DDELALLDGHVELIAGEACDRKRDPQPLGLAVLAGNPLDIVGWIAVRGLGDTIERTLDLVESEQEGAGQRRNSGHGLKALVSDFEGTLTAPPDRPDGRSTGRSRKYGEFPSSLQERPRLGTAAKTPRPNAFSRCRCPTM